MTLPASDGIDRREALRRAALFLGGALSTGTITGVLAGCAARSMSPQNWAPRLFAREQADLVATIAEHIIPETDTPGARAAGVHRFIDAMVAQSYADGERRRFLAGLAGVDARALQAHGRAFLACSAAEQRGILESLDREAYAPTADRGEPPFFRTLKDLVLVGYYTSEAGATRELRHEPVPGRFDGCVPFADVGRTWAV